MDLMEADDLTTYSFHYNKSVVSAAAFLAVAGGPSEYLNFREPPIPGDGNPDAWQEDEAVNSCFRMLQVCS